MKYKQIVALLNLLNVSKIGSQKVRSLVSKFKDVEQVFSLSTSELCGVAGIDLKSAQVIQSYNNFDFGQKLLEKSYQQNINVVTYWDKDYPLLLKKIYDPPVLLFSIGKRTLAVLGSGLDIIYPSENYKLAQNIIEDGTIISEFPLGTKPEAGNFPKRNRIISGLCHATIVVEAGDRSGAILTALNAVDQNREVFAVPGRVTDKQSLGCNRLIRNGAIPFQNAEQIFQNISNRLFNPMTPIQQSIRLDLSKREQAVVKHLSDEPIHVDVLCNKSGIEVTALLGILLSLELKGAVAQVGGKQFVLA